MTCSFFKNKKARLQSLNKNSRLIRADYVLPKAPNIISLIRTPRRLFIFLIATVLPSLLRALCLRLSLAYGSCLMADVRRCSCYDAAFQVTLKSNLPLKSAVQFDRDRSPIGHIPGDSK